MIRKLMIAAMTMGLLAGGFGVAQAKNAEGDQGSAKIAYVDLNRALNEVAEGKKAKAQLEADGKAKKQKLEIMQKEFETMRADFDKQRLVLSGEALQKKQEALQQKLIELQKTSMDFEKEFAQKEAQLTQPIAEKLKNVIGDVGREGSYTAILPKEMMLYAPT